ncbi:hypothetical protein Y1Q_0015721 [Alligator mississippiensis]|uniref:Uncharacterized protein n=1 Tax=Alligator mississippiensis TaxID=8496 RepID=A0A151NNR8_ALLMI|nr:hypothetical protein Y1Q_0015721 [Alligator mississippiensis]
MPHTPCFWEEQALAHLNSRLNGLESTRTTRLLQSQLLLLWSWILLGDPAVSTGGNLGMRSRNRFGEIT